MANLCSIATSVLGADEEYTCSPTAEYDFSESMHNSINNLNSISSPDSLSSNSSFYNDYGLKRKEREYSDDSDQEEEVSPRLAKLLANEDNLPPHKLKAEIRKQKNRDAAAMSRKRNRDKMQRLEQEVQLLMQRNMELEQCISDIMKSELLEPLPYYYRSDSGNSNDCSGDEQSHEEEEGDGLCEEQHEESGSTEETSLRVDTEPLEFDEASTGFLQSLLSADDCEDAFQPQAFEAVS